jgi:hypothetical protein
MLVTQMTFMLSGSKMQNRIATRNDLAHEVQFAQISQVHRDARGCELLQSRVLRIACVAAGEDGIDSGALQVQCQARADEAARARHQQP